MKAGVSEDDAHIYAEGIRRGGSLVTARVDDARAESAEAILRSSNGVDIVARGKDYAKEGWERFNETAEPMAVGVPPVAASSVGRI